MAGSVWCSLLLMVLPTYTAHRVASPIRVDGKLDEPAWFAAPPAGAFVFPWWKSGDKEQTLVKVLWDDDNLYIAHISYDRHITARHAQRDGRISEDDCFELMIAPDPARPEVYYNLEWNVIGGLVDNFRPNGPKQPRAPKWDAEGVRVAGSYEGTLNNDTDRDAYWIAEVAIPWRNFPGAAPKPGATMNVNFNRHGGDTNMQYSQWSAGDTDKPSFHTPHRFGKLVLSGETLP